MEDEQLLPRLRMDNGWRLIILNEAWVPPNFLPKKHYNFSELGHDVVPHAAYFSYKSHTAYPYSEHLYDAENMFKEFISSRTLDFYITKLNKLLSRCPACVDFNPTHFHKEIFHVVEIYSDESHNSKRQLFLCSA